MQKKDVMSNEKRALIRLEDKLKNKEIESKLIQSESPPKRKSFN
jgi:hypothetical protein